MLFLLDSRAAKRDQLVRTAFELRPRTTMCQPRDDSIPTRDTLLNRLKDWRDDASWREFFETYWELIYNFARKSGLTEVEAEEVVQETVIGVAKKIEQFKTGAEHGSFKSWLLQQTHWRIADQFRRRARFDCAARIGEGAEDSGLGGEDTCTAPVDRLAD